MNHESFEVELRDRVAHVRLSRPDKRNSMNARFWAELPALVSELEQDGEARAIVLSSTGPHFSTGMDVSVFASKAADEGQANAGQRAARFHDTVIRLQRSFSCLEAARIPVLAAIQGGCVGAGVDLVTACDMRYATKDAYFTIYETNLAMTADVGTFPRICKLMPDGIVRELAYTGRPMGADEALQYGLVNKLYDSQEEMVESVLKIAASIASKAPMAVYGCKRMILHARDHTVADTLDYVALWNASYFQHAEVAEAMSAQAEKRPGNFVALPAVQAADDPLEIP
ncbi:crotonase/enoyl-CoA hydratase family protein [Granulosicoccus antarcticus]|uniref:Short-chain-enoyl-CoA hydratase n=1 Tax=Granulosicoccus antarcticus IMCC3135 TaxID=1192854 RepID=A0A2Z2NUY3_9GAMM|nr:crotonase/enoyl-CoA hydratase family protein [Granulosicoccus antarcticus]ASJ72600.1 Short-chain-enoyl-CoA hydratase [Granulosicoccus antarcticus IMCC3135]